MSAQVQKYLIWSAAIIVALIAIALIRGQTTVKLPISQ
jgi:hypothetical protein